jgi:glycosidase
MSEREFHIMSEVRKRYGFDHSLYQLSGNVIFANPQAVRQFCQLVNKTKTQADQWLPADVNAMALIDEINHYLVRLYKQRFDTQLWQRIFEKIDAAFGSQERQKMIYHFTTSFEPLRVYLKQQSCNDYLSGVYLGESGWQVQLEELWMLYLTNANPAIRKYSELFVDHELRNQTIYLESIALLREHLSKGFSFGPEGETLFDLLEKPFKLFPNDLQGQLGYMQRQWSGHFELEGVFESKLAQSLLLIKSEAFQPKSPFSHDAAHADEAMQRALRAKARQLYTRNVYEPEAFTDDEEWMPNVVMIAKNALVWLDQLSRQYERAILHLSDIPDAELERLARAGINTLWLIGIWQRSYASKRIKQIMGNAEAAASAYSLEDNCVAHDIGGWDALAHLRSRAAGYGIRLASDMVPNHTGMDSKWVAEHPDYFLQRSDLPYDYHFDGENLTQRPDLQIYLENGYFRKSDAAVVFKHVAHGRVRYMYHGNDGTVMPWNDTAQIDFLNPAAKEAVIQEILNMSHNFSVIRLDAAMVLVKKHIQRLWYPSLYGEGDCIASRLDYAMSDEEFDRLMPVEFWREVVDRIAQERPQTLLIAEAFWMLEGYFVRSLGMHRVYNSAFMHMLMDEDNRGYREFIKKTITFDLGILKRFVNFMSNPDEETAIEQFGSGDKYLGVTMLMATLPGLPMFAHGQLEGFAEKYGMEYTHAKWHEVADHALWQRHQQYIFPLLHRRELFSNSTHFRLYPLWHNGAINENVYIFSNRLGSESALVLYNNVYGEAQGFVDWSDQYKGDQKSLTSQRLSVALGVVGGDRKYLLFQAHRSGLWFIRRSNEVLHQGLEIMMGAYYSEVFWHFSEVEDVDGHYGALHDKLQGGGSPYNLHDFRVNTFYLEQEITVLSQMLIPLSQQSYRDFDPPSLIKDKIVETKPSVAGNTKASSKGAAVVLENWQDIRSQLERIASLCDAKVELSPAQWEKMEQEYRYLLLYYRSLSATGRDFYRLHRRYIAFAHYAFWVDKLHLMGLSAQELASPAIEQSLALWRADLSGGSEHVHLLAVALLSSASLVLDTPADLKPFWSQLLQESIFMQQVGVNSHSDKLYYHDESLQNALACTLAKLYLEQNMQKKLYDNPHKLGLLAQHKRWQLLRERSKFDYQQFIQLMLK